MEKASLKLYVDIFKAFLGPGSLTFGGGPSAIPLMQKEVVDNYKWLTAKEFTDALALGNTLPGPIATKMSALIGYELGGWLGAVIGVVSTVLPTALAIIMLMGVYDKFKDAQWMKGMMKAVRPVVVVMIAQAAYKLAPTSFTGITTVVIAILAVIGLEVVKMHPALLIVIALCYGGVFMK